MSEAVVVPVDDVLEFHEHVASLGWVALDLYDGSVLVERGTSRLVMVDIDEYRRGPVRNTMGRMHGSSRFMAPEEYQLGAAIDERTNVTALGQEAYDVAARAWSRERGDRWPSIAAMRAAWAAATG